MRTQLTIVGGGLAGLVAASAASEAGMDVTLHEARRELGGRARTTRGAHHANWGPHVLYADGPLWAWLHQRGLAEPAHGYPYQARFVLRAGGRASMRPPRGFFGALLKLRRASAPVDRSFQDWASEWLADEATAARAAAFMGVATFDHDPGRLSAAFVHERLRRALSLPPAVRYIPGGWATLATRLAGHARALGVRIETGNTVDALPPAPVILAVPLPRAAALLGDESLTWTGTRTALLDVGMTRRRLDPLVVSDLDAPGFAETYTIPDASLAPPGEHLVQAQAGLRQGEDLAGGVARLEGLLDSGFHGWRQRETWRRAHGVTDESGALDLPGTTWRDRPAVDRGDGVYIAGDMTAAPGLLSEVSYHSALAAVAHVAKIQRVPVG
jgi:phytoene dehydrogenase-like protein